MRWLKALAAIVAALIAWFVIATLGNLLMRTTWPDYAAVERAMAFTFPMMFARLVLGALSSLCAGFVVGWLSKGSTAATCTLIVLLVAAFAPVHFQLWDKFPGWYHAIFFASLVVLTALGTAGHSRFSPKTEPSGATQ